MRGAPTRRAAADRAMGEGAAGILPRVTLNIGTIQGGLKVNMIPGECSFEADFRLPVGMSREHLMSEIESVLASYPEAILEETNCNLPSFCDPYGDMVEIIQNTVETLRGFRPLPVLSLGGTDTRLWRYANVPAYVYGVFPRGMGSCDEHCEVEEFLHVVRTHVLSAYDYLMAG